MKVLHLASFTGNIGDNANHSGFRAWFEGMVGVPVSWTDLEIREYYWKERRFDESFLEMLGSFDLLVIGGGNYFELWVDRSHTGTSIDIPPEIFARIAIPVFFNALGCDAGQGASEVALSRFRAFMDVLTASERYLVTVRNDGAGAVIRKVLPAQVADQVTVIPDGGFFLAIDSPPMPDGAAPKLRIALNLACDMPEIRFAAFGGAAGGYEKFCDEFAAFIDTVSRQRPDVHFVLFPHIHSDLRINSDLVARLGDRLRRTRVSTAPYVTGAAGARHVYGLYARCDLVLGMRFHANVCAFGTGVPSLGLYNYPQIKFLYDELDSADRCFDVRQPGYSATLAPAVIDSLGRLGELRERCRRTMARVQGQRQSFEPRFRQWLRANSLGSAS
jgi:polysaccharide pyruvyl transferase WcaK-like protein